MPYKDKDKKRTRDLRWYHENSGKVKPRMREYTNSHPRRSEQPIQYLNRRNTERRQMLRELIQQQKMGRVCMRCGIDDWRVLDFHHLDKDGKEGTIGHAVSENWSVKRILQEIAKCETFCANCHRILHWEERNGDI